MDTTENKMKVSYFWKGLALFLIGLIVGVIVSPVKNGVSIGNNNHIVNNENKDEEEKEE